MIKQLIQVTLLIVFSILIVLCMSYVQQGIHWLIDAHDWVSHMLTSIFSGGEAGNLVRGLIALLFIPVLVALIPTIVYLIVRRRWWPYFMQIIWIVWLIQTGALVAAAKI